MSLVRNFRQTVFFPRTAITGLVALVAVCASALKLVATPVSEAALPDERFGLMFQDTAWRYWSVCNDPCIDTQSKPIPGRDAAPEADRIFHSRETSSSLKNE